MTLSFPHKFVTNTRLPQFLEEHKNMKRGEEATDIEVRMGLRIMSIRKASAHLIFYVCKSEGRTIQIMAQSQNAKGPVPFEKQHELLARGDIVGVIGWPGVTAPKNRPDGKSQYGSYTTALIFFVCRRRFKCLFPRDHTAHPLPEDVAH